MSISSISWNESIELNLNILIRTRSAVQQSLYHQDVVYNIIIYLTSNDLRVLVMMYYNNS